MKIAMVQIATILVIATFGCCGNRGEIKKNSNNKTIFIAGSSFKKPINHSKQTPARGTTNLRICRNLEESLKAIIGKTGFNLIGQPVCLNNPEKTKTISSYFLQSPPHCYALVWKCSKEGVKINVSLTTDSEIEPPSRNYYELNPQDSIKGRVLCPKLEGVYKLKVKVNLNDTSEQIFCSFAMAGD